MKVHGHCLCGAIQFEMETRANSTVHCHCERCRRAHGAPFVTWVGCSTASLHVSAGADRLRRFQSSPECVRSFCGDCGSPLFFESARWPGETSVALPHLRESLAELDHPVRAHIYCSDGHSWLKIDDGLPRLGGPSGHEPLDPDA